MTAHLLPVGTPPSCAYECGQVAHVPGVGWWAITPDGVAVTLRAVTEHAPGLVSAVCCGWLLWANEWHAVAGDGQAA